MSLATSEMSLLEIICTILGIQPCKTMRGSSNYLYLAQAGEYGGFFCQSVAVFINTEGEGLVL